MRTLLGAVLGVIAVGVLLIAYGLLGPRMAASDPYQLARPGVADDRVGMDRWTTMAATPQLQLRCEAGQRAVIRQVAGAAAAECVDDAYASPRASLAGPVVHARQVSLPEDYQEPRRAPRARVVRSSGRDWVKTAMMIGESSAAGAGIGGIFDGKRGALIGAAIGGGAGTLFEVAKR